MIINQTLIGIVNGKYYKYLFRRLIVKHELKGVLKYIGVKTCIPSPDRDRQLSNAPSLTMADIAAKSNSTIGIL
jgi:hypothetical protein